MHSAEGFTRWSGPSWDPAWPPTTARTGPRLGTEPPGASTCATSRRPSRATVIHIAACMSSLRRRPERPMLGRLSLAKRVAVPACCRTTPSRRLPCVKYRVSADQVLRAGMPASVPRIQISARCRKQTSAVTKRQLAGATCDINCQGHVVTAACQTYISCMPFEFTLAAHGENVHNWRNRWLTVSGMTFV